MPNNTNAPSDTPMLSAEGGPASGGRHSEPIPPKPERTEIMPTPPPPVKNNPPILPAKKTAPPVPPVIAKNKTYDPAILLVVFIIIIIGVAVGVIIWNHNKNKTTTPDTAESIRNAFNVPASSTPGIASNFNPPNPNPNLTPNGTTVPVTYPQAGQGQIDSPAYTNTPNVYLPPRGPSTAYTPPPINNNNQPAYSGPPQVAGESVYHNANFGFELTIPSGWANNPEQDSNHVFFFSSSGQQAGYVEVYAADGTNLNDIAQTLQASPDVSRVNQTTVNGIPALQFTARGQQGLALMTSTHIYYLRGALVNVSNQIRFF